MSVHGLEYAVEVLLLIGEELSKCFLASFNSLRKNHLAHSLNLVCLEEHVLCTAQTDTYCTKVTGNFCVVGSVCIGANYETGVLVAKFHKLCKIARHFCGFCLYFAEVNFACRTIYRKVVTFFDYHAFDLYCASFVVYVDGACARYTAFTHAACYHCCVRGHTATCGEDAFCCRHTSEVFR